MGRVRSRGTFRLLFFFSPLSPVPWRWQPCVSRIRLLSLKHRRERYNDGLFSFHQIPVWETSPFLVMLFVKLVLRLNESLISSSSRSFLCAQDWTSKKYWNTAVFFWVRTPTRSRTLSLLLGWLSDPNPLKGQSLLCEHGDGYTSGSSCS